MFVKILFGICIAVKSSMNDKFSIEELLMYDL